MTPPPAKVKGLSWAKDQSEKLKIAKRYLKSDLKVGLHIHYNTSVAKAMKVLRKLRCLQIEVGIVQSLCRNDCHQVILLGQVLEIVE